MEDEDVCSEVESPVGARVGMGALDRDNDEGDNEKLGRDLYRELRSIDNWDEENKPESQLVYFILFRPHELSPALDC